MKRRVLSLILALILCLGMLPAGALAAEETEAGVTEGVTGEEAGDATIGGEEESTETTTTSTMPETLKAVEYTVSAESWPEGEEQPADITVRIANIYLPTNASGSIRLRVELDCPTTNSYYVYFNGETSRKSASYSNGAHTVVYRPTSGTYTLSNNYTFTMKITLGSDVVYEEIELTTYLASHEEFPLAWEQMSYNDTNYLHQDRENFGRTIYYAPGTALDDYDADELGLKLVKDGVVYAINRESDTLTVYGPYYTSNDPRYADLFQDSANNYNHYYAYKQMNMTMYRTRALEIGSYDVQVYDRATGDVIYTFTGFENVTAVPVVNVSTYINQAFSTNIVGADTAYVQLFVHGGQPGEFAVTLSDPNGNLLGTSTTYRVVNRYVAGFNAVYPIPLVDTVLEPGVSYQIGVTSSVHDDFIASAATLNLSKYTIQVPTGILTSRYFASALFQVGGNVTTETPLKFELYQGSALLSTAYASPDAQGLCDVAFLDDAGQPVALAAGASYQAKVYYGSSSWQYYTAYLYNQQAAGTASSSSGISASCGCADGETYVHLYIYPDHADYAAFQNTEGHSFTARLVSMTGEETDPITMTYTAKSYDTHMYYKVTGSVPAGLAEGYYYIDLYHDGELMVNADGEGLTHNGKSYPFMPAALPSVSYSTSTYNGMRFFIGVNPNNGGAYESLRTDFFALGNNTTTPDFSYIWSGDSLRVTSAITDNLNSAVPYVAVQYLDGKVTGHSYYYYYIGNYELLSTLKSAENADTCNVALSELTAAAKGGTIELLTPSGESASSVPVYTEVFVNAVPEEGYRLKPGSITVNGEAITGRSFLATEDTVVGAEFELAPVATYTPTINIISYNGTVTLDKTEYEAGETVTVTVTPNEGYKINRSATSMYFNTNGTTYLTDMGDGTYTFVMPMCDVTIYGYINFQTLSKATVNLGSTIPDTVALTLSDKDGNIITPSDTCVTEGATVYVDVTVTDGYQLDEIYLDDAATPLVATETAGRYSFVMPAYGVWLYAACSESTGGEGEAAVSNLRFKLSNDMPSLFWDVPVDANSNTWYYVYYSTDAGATWTQLTASWSANSQNLRGMDVGTYNAFKVEARLDGAVLGDCTNTDLTLTVTEQTAETPAVVTLAEPEEEGGMYTFTVTGLTPKTYFKLNIKRNTESGTTGATFSSVGKTSDSDGAATATESSSAMADFLADATATYWVTESIDGAVSGNTASFTVVNHGENLLSSIPKDDSGSVGNDYTVTVTKDGNIYHLAATITGPDDAAEGAVYSCRFYNSADTAVSDVLSGMTLGAAHYFRLEAGTYDSYEVLDADGTVLSCGTLAKPVIVTAGAFAHSDMTVTRSDTANADGTYTYILTGMDTMSYAYVLETPSNSYFLVWEKFTASADALDSGATLYALLIGWDTSTSFTQQFVPTLTIKSTDDGEAGDAPVFPAECLTRAEVCVAVVNAMGWKYTADMTVPFTDVSTADEAYQAIAVMYNRGIVTGATGDGTVFEPNSGITRAQLARLLCLVLGKEGAVDAAVLPSDVPAASWTAGYICAVLSEGLMTTDANNNFDPSGYALEGAADFDKLAQLGGAAVPAEPVQLKIPTNVEWGKYYYSVMDYDTGVSTLASADYPGMISWVVADTMYDHAYQVKVYKVGTDGAEAVFDSSWKYKIGKDTRYTDHDFSLSFLPKLESGDYYFTVQAMGDGTATADSDVVTSGVWTYTASATQLDAPTGLTWDDTTISWNEVDDKSVGGYLVQIYYSAEKDSEDMEKVDSFVAYSCEEIMTSYALRDWVLEEYGTGYYYARVKTVSADVNVASHSVFTDFSEPYYYENIVTVSTEITGEGKIVLKSDSVAIGQTLQFSVKPALGYTLSSLSYSEGTPEDTTEVITLSTTQNAYYLWPTESTITIYAVFTKLSEQPNMLNNSDFSTYQSNWSGSLIIPGEFSSLTSYLNWNSSFVRTVLVDGDGEQALVQESHGGYSWINLINPGDLKAGQYTAYITVGDDTQIIPLGYCTITLLDAYPYYANINGQLATGASSVKVNVNVEQLSPVSLPNGLTLSLTDKSGNAVASSQDFRIVYYGKEKGTTAGNKEDSDYVYSGSSLKFTLDLTNAGLTTDVSYYLALTAADGTQFINPNRYETCATADPVFNNWSFDPDTLIWTADTLNIPAGTYATYKYRGVEGTTGPDMIIAEDGSATMVFTEWPFVDGDNGYIWAFISVPYGDNGNYEKGFDIQYHDKSGSTDTVKAWYRLEIGSAAYVNAYENNTYFDYVIPYDGADVQTVTVSTPATSSGFYQVYDYNNNLVASSGVEDLSSFAISLVGVAIHSNYRVSISSDDDSVSFNDTTFQFRYDVALGIDRDFYGNVREDTVVFYPTAAVTEDTFRIGYLYCGDKVELPFTVNDDGSVSVDVSSIPCGAWKPWATIQMQDKSSLEVYDEPLLIGNWTFWANSPADTPDGPRVAGLEPVADEETGSFTAQVVYENGTPASDVTMTVYQVSDDELTYRTAVNIGTDNYTISANDLELDGEYVFYFTLADGTVLDVEYATFGAENVSETISGICGIDGDNLTWTLVDTSEEGDGSAYTLTISGEGAMASYEYSTTTWDVTTPWVGYSKAITKVIVEEGVTTIGAYAFSYLYRLTSVELPETVTTIGTKAFMSCENLKSLTIPASVTTIEGSAFSWNYFLSEVTFLGDAPAFGDYAFSGVISVCYYPADNDTWTESKMQSYNGTLTWAALGNDGVVAESSVLTDSGLLCINGTSAASGTGWSWDGKTLTLDGTVEGFAVSAIRFSGLLSYANITLAGDTTLDTAPVAALDMQIPAIEMRGRESTLEINTGSYKLVINGVEEYTDGINTYGSLYIGKSTLEVTAHSIPILVDGGNLDISDSTVTTTGSNYDGIEVQGIRDAVEGYLLKWGELTITDSNVSAIDSGSNAIYCDGDMTITKSNVIATTNDGNNGFGNDCGNIVITDSTISITADYIGICTYGTLTINNSTVSVIGAENAVRIGSREESEEQTAKVEDFMLVNCKITIPENGKIIATSYAWGEESYETVVVVDDNDDSTEGWITEIKIEPSNTGDDEELEVTVTYNLNTDDENVWGDLTPSSVKSGDTVSLPVRAQDFDRPYYVFKGWFTKPEGGEQVTDETPITGDCTLYAHWEERTTITLILYVSEITGTDPETGESVGDWVTDATVVLTAPDGSVIPAEPGTGSHEGGLLFRDLVAADAYTLTITRDGYKTYTITTQGDPYDAGISLAEMGLYSGGVIFSTAGIWEPEPETYTVTYDLNTTDENIWGELAPVTVESGKTVELPVRATDFDRPYYVFKGWFTAPEGGEEVTNETPIAGNCTLYAHWEERTTITLILGVTEITGTDPETGESVGGWVTDAVVVMTAPDGSIVPAETGVGDYEGYLVFRDLVAADAYTLTITRNGYKTYTLTTHGDPYDAGISLAEMGLYSGGVIFSTAGIWEPIDDTLPEPTLTVSVNKNTGKPIISWTAVEGAANYEVWCCDTKNGTYTLLTTISANEQSVTHTGAEIGEDYFYKVRAINGDVKGEYSTTKGVWCDLPAPTITVTTKASTGKPYITWTAVEGATGYDVYRCDTKSGTYTKLVSTVSTKLNVTHTGAEIGEDYFYKVRAVYGDNTSCNSAFSAIKGVWCDLPQTTVKVTTKASTGKPYITWTAVEGATGYDVYYCDTSTGTYKLLYTAKANKLNVTHTGAKAGEDYYYKVRAVYGDNTSCNSALTAAKGVWCDLKAPTIKVTNRASDGKPYISWAAVEGATGYKVYCAVGSSTGTYKQIYSTTNPNKLSVTHIGAEAGEAYFYKVIATHSNSKCTSGYSSAKGVYCDLARPTLNVELNSNGKPYITWTAVEGASSYKVYCSVDGGAYKLLYTDTTGRLYCTHNGAKAGTEYSYKVVAICAATSKGNSAYSIAKTITV